MGDASKYLKSYNIQVFGIPATDLLKGPNTKLDQTTEGEKPEGTYKEFGMLILVLIGVGASLAASFYIAQGIGSIGH